MFNSVKFSKISPFMNVLMRSETSIKWRMALQQHKHHAQKNCITISTDVQNCTKCWRVDSTPQLCANKQLSGCKLPADVR